MVKAKDLLNPRFALAQRLAMVGFDVTLVNIITGGYLPVGGVPSGMILGPIGAFTSIAAFFVSLHKKSIWGSIIVSGLLIVTGTMLAIDSYVVSGNLTVLIFPGPALGFIFGVVVLVLGIVKSIMARREMTRKTATAASL